MLRTTVRLLLAPSLALLLAACSGDSGSGGDTSQDRTPSPSGGETAPAVTGPVAARVDGAPIAVSEVQRIYETLKRQNMEPDPDVEGDTPDERLYRTALKRLISQKVVEASAAAAGVNVTDGQVENEIAQIKASAGGDAAFQRLLDQNQTTLESVRHDIRTGILFRNYFTQLTGAWTPQPTEEELRAYFDDNSDQFAPQERVHARHILIRTTPDMDDIAKAEARQKIQAALTRVKDGEDFATVANEVTEDPTNSGKGGDLGWFGHGAMVAPFDSAAFALEPGEVSGIVETQFGYHILKVEETKQTEPRKFEDVKMGIQNMLVQQMKQDRFEAMVDSLRDAATVEVEEVTEDQYRDL